MSEPSRVSLIGAFGRLGQAISRVAETNREVAVVARAGRDDSLEDVIRDGEIVIDVSHADAVERVSAVCVQHRKPLVIGTTGHSAAQLQIMRDAATTIAVVLAPNFSVGVNALVWLAAKAAGMLDDSFEIEIVESHHRMKKDAPSGTAKQLAQALCEARDLRYDSDVVHERTGTSGERPARQIGVHALRGGDIVGEHTVIFTGNGERLELTHRASHRDIFAAGALRAARWIIGRSAGLYTMQDVLGLDAQR